MTWARESLVYLATVRTSAHEDFNAAMNEVREFNGRRHDEWFSKTKNILQALYHSTMEFLGDGNIPGSEFSSPASFETKLTAHHAFISRMKTELSEIGHAYEQGHKERPPYFFYQVCERVDHSLDAIDHVISTKPSETQASDDISPIDRIAFELNILCGLAKRFHECVLSLRQHPHNGKVFCIGNEWDCQYLFRSILCAYFEEIRDEEWNPSNAGSSTRCEFLLKPQRTMIELKYVRKAAD